MHTTDIDWQPIETAPKDGTRILLFMAPEIPWDIVIGEYRDNSLYGPTWAFEDGHSTPLDGATHWAPLPSGPKKKVVS